MLKNNRPTWRLDIEELLSFYQLFSKNNDGEKMEIMEKYLNFALNSENPMQWIFLFLEIARYDKSPCVIHEAVFNIGRVYIKHDFSRALIKHAKYVANEFCKLIESTDSLVVKHETMESIGDAGFDTDATRELLKRYSSDLNNDLANTARISYWQITGKEFNDD